jgi:hypothetical protein
MEGTVRDLLPKLPLADAVWQLWSTVVTEPFLHDLYEEHRGRCYKKLLSFPVLVNVVTEALCQHRGSAHQMLVRADEQDQLDASIQAVYGKLRRLPIKLSEAFLGECTQRLRPFFPTRLAVEPPASLAAFRIVLFDGKTLKRAAKRLKTTRGRAGTGLGGRALVGLELQTGLICAFSAHADGHANEANLVPQLLPQIRQRLPGIRLWTGDRQFGDVVQIQRLSTDGDHFVLRHHPRTTFTPDPDRGQQTGTDRFGRTYTQEWGWLSSKRRQQRVEVRRIVLQRPGQEAVILVTDLFDARQYPATDLLEVYRERWGIERVFQQVSEVFHLLHLIGSTPEAAIFQCGVCMVLYNLLQVVRAIVADTQNRPVAEISSEKLFYDLHRELIALHTLVPRQEIVHAIPQLAATHASLACYLRQRLKDAWTTRWLKAKPKKYRPPQPKKVIAGSHFSIYRAIQEAKPPNDKDV